MAVPFKLIMPDFKIKGKDISFTCLISRKIDMEKAIAVIDYWSIKDTKGHCVQSTPDGKNCYLPHDMQGKKIELIMKDAGKCLIYDTLDICVHFLTQNGSSISIYYQYNNFRGTLSFVRAEEGQMDKNDESILIDMLIKANEYERNHKQDDENKKEEPQNKQHNGEDNGFFEEYAEDLRVFAKAIDREMRFLRNNGGRKYKVTNGQFVMQSQGGYIYSFDLDAELYLAEDSPVTVTVGLDAISGTVLVCENFQIMIALERIPRSDTSLKIPKADISAEPWKLLQKLNECLRRVRQTNTIAMMLVKEGPTLAVPGLLSDIAKGQEKAYSHALTSPITVIWGPPGTGKTYTMAKISMEFLRQEKKVLIVSHSNVSVDNVAKQIFNQIQQDSLSFLLQKSKILRYGYVRDEELQENDLITSFKAAMRDSKEKSEYDCLQKKYKKLTEDAETSSDPKIKKEILLINQRLKVIAAKFKEVEKSLVADALLIATTVSKIYADSLFDYKTYDVVMFDEISMAYIPQIVAAASFAKEHLICVGDFRQLSPIVQEKNAKVVLGKDLFEFLNISKGFRDINPHPWLIMLDEQRRMHPAISAFPAKYIYSGLLKNHESVISNRNAIGKAAPFNQPMALIDLYGTCCFGSKNEDNSRFNILSAVFAFATALKSEKGQKQFADIRNEDKVGIITPYAAQTRLIKAMIQDYRHSNRNTSISCATVHQFQGSERNTIIFDAVESCPSTRAGWLMAKNEGGSVTRLINVAITRARGKFIVIANKAFWLNKFDTDNMFYSLIKYMNTSSHILNYQKNALAEFITHNDFSSNIKVYSSEIECNCDLLADIRSVKNEIKLLIPRGRLNPEYGKRIMDEIHKQKLNKKVIVYDKSVVVPMEYENSCIPSDKITMPILLIDNKVWYGLPIYRHDSTDGQVSYPIYTDIIVRFTGKHTVEMIRSLVEHANVKPPVMTNLALYVKNNCHCIQCGQALTLVKANKHFLRCNDCNKTQVLTKEMVNRYLDSTGGKCSRCGRDMFAVNGQYGLYVRCSENHTYKLDEI